MVNIDYSVEKLINKIKELCKNPNNYKEALISLDLIKTKFNEDPEYIKYKKENLKKFSKSNIQKTNRKER